MHNPVFRFGDFEVRGSSYELLRAGERVKIERIPMDLLILLVENHGDLVSRDEIVQRLWGDGIFLETEHSINTAINKLRSILHDHPKDPVFIQTVIGKGYRFIAKVEMVEYNSAGSTLPGAELSSPSPGPVLEAVQRAFAEVPATPAEDESVGGSALPVASDTAASPYKPASAILAFPAEHSPTRREILVQWAPAALAFIALAGLIGFAVRDLKVGARPAANLPYVVAVLPFSDLSDNSGQDYPVDGITDEVTTLLARSGSLRVISRRSTMQYKGVQRPLAQIAGDLHVDAVVEGSVVHSGKAVRITAQLLDPKNDQHLWAEVYRDSGEEPVATQDRVATDIAHEVALRLTKQALATEHEPIDLRARDFLLRGRSPAETPAPTGTE